MKILTQSVHPTRFGTAAKPPEEKTEVASVAASASPKTVPVPPASLKAYTLFGKASATASPTAPKFGASLPGFDLPGFLENDELDFRVERLYQQARANAKGDEVTPEDWLLAVLKDFLEDTQPESKHGSSYLGQVLGLHGNNDKYLASDKGQQEIAAVRQAADALEEHLDKQPAGTTPQGRKEASLELLKLFSSGKQTWASLQQTSLTPDGLPMFLGEDILLQTLSTSGNGKAAQVLQDLGKALNFKPQYSVKDHLEDLIPGVSERLAEVPSVDAGTTVQLPPEVRTLDVGALRDARKGQSGIQGQSLAFQALRQVLDSTKNTEALEKLGVRPTNTAILAGTPGVGKTDLALEFAEKNGVDFIVTVDGKALAKKPPAEIKQTLRTALGQAWGRANVQLPEGAQRPKVMFFVDNLETRLTGDTQGLSPNASLASFFVESLLNSPSFHSNVMTVGATSNPAELQQVGSLNLPLKVIAVNAPQQPQEQATVMRSLAEGYNQAADHTIFAEDVDYEGLAARLVGKSGRDLQGVMGRAIERALQEQGDLQSLTVSNKVLQATIDEMEIGAEHHETLEKMPGKTRQLIAYHELGHAFGLTLMNKLLGSTGAEVDRLTIVPHGGALGFTAPRSAENRYENSQSGMLAQLVKAMASIPAEKLYSGEMHTTPQSDLQMANGLAVQYVAHLGMGKNKVLYNPEQPLPDAVLQEANDLIQTAEKLAEVLLKPLAPLFKSLSEEVLSQESISGELLRERLDAYLKENPRVYRKMQRDALRVLSNANLLPERIQRTGLLRRRTLAPSPIANTASTSENSTRNTDA